MVTDISDGWYELVLTSSEITPDIQVSIGEAVVATGKPNEIDVEERPPIVSDRPPGDTGEQEDSPLADLLDWLCWIFVIVLSVLVIFLIIRLMNRP